MNCTKETHSLIGAIRAAMLLAAAIVISGCDALPRNAVPVDAAGRAEIPGMVQVRFWGDEVDESLLELARDNWRREVEYARRHDLPVAAEGNFLALSGGGADGAFGAGLLCGWTEAGTRPTFKIVTGISTGALIAPFAFLGPDYDHVLRDVYTSVSTRDIVSMRGIVDGLLSDSLTDSTPLMTMLEKYIDGAFLARVAEEFHKGRSLIIGTTDLDAQRPVIWSMGRIASSGDPDAVRLFRQVMLASASIPGALPPVYIDVELEGRRYEEMHVDGGTTTQVFMYPASLSLKKVAEEGGISRPRHIYVIRNSRLKPHAEITRRRSLPIAARAVSTLIKTQGVGDLYRIYLGAVRDELDFNLAYIPDEFTALPKEMFDPPYMRELFQLGYDQAKAGYPWKKAPPGFEPPEERIHVGGEQ